MSSLQLSLTNWLLRAGYRCARVSRGEGREEEGIGDECGPRGKLLISVNEQKRRPSLGRVSTRRQFRMVVPLNPRGV